MSASPPASIVSLQSVSKAFAENDVLTGVSIDIAPHQIFGFIGPSGCGKTTLVRLIVGLLEPTTGTAHVLGVEPRNFAISDRQRIGYTSQGFQLYPTLSVEQNARFVAGLYGIGWRARRRRIREVLEFLELWDARRRLARDVSGGMQRRLSLACALLHVPPLLVIDEPTSGLDPVLRAKVWRYLEELRDRGTTVIVTTQHIEEAEHCDRLAVLRAGKLLAEGPPEQLREAVTGGEVIDIEATGLRRGDVAALWALDDVRRVDWTGGQRVRVTVGEAATTTAAITHLLEERAVTVHAIRPYIPTFDEVFVSLVEW